MNTAIFRSLIWQLKMVSVALGIVLLGLTTSKDFYILYREAEFFLAIVIITFMVTVVWIGFAFIDALSENELLSKLDFFYHIVSGALLIIGAICWAVATDRWGDCFGACKSVYTQNIFASVFGFIDGILYILIGFLLFRASSGPA